MPKRHHLSTGNALHVPHKCCRVLSPLAPFVDMSSWAGTLAMTAQINRECRETVPRHPEGEALVSPRVLAKSVHDRERDSGTRFRPGTVRELGTVSRVDRAFAGDRAVSRQGNRSLSGSSPLLVRLPAQSGHRP